MEKVQLVFALKILESFSTVLNHFQEIYQYISVDEAQDTSKIQHEMSIRVFMVLERPTLRDFWILKKFILEQKYF